MTIEILSTDVTPKQRSRNWDGEAFVYSFPILTVKAKVDGITRTTRVPLYTCNDETVQLGIEGAINHWAKL